MTASNTPATSTTAKTGQAAASNKGSLDSLGGGGGLLTFLVASLAVIALALYVTRWMAKWQYTQGRGRRLRVVEGMAIGKDRQLLLVQVGKEVLLLGSSEGGVNLVHKVEDPDLIKDCVLQPPAERPLAPTPSFSSVESSIRANLDRMRGLMTKNGGKRDA